MNVTHNAHLFFPSLKYCIYLYIYQYIPSLSIISIHSFILVPFLTMPTSMHCLYLQCLHRERLGPVISQSFVRRHLKVVISSVVQRMKNV